VASSNRTATLRNSRSRENPKPDEPSSAVVPQAASGSGDTGLKDDVWSLGQSTSDVLFKLAVNSI
jgi:hypothetical protein